MQRSGIVSILNRKQGLVAIRAERGDYAIFELLYELRLDENDTVIWNDRSDPGFVHLSNVSTGAQDDVYVRHLSIAEADIRRCLLL